MAEWKEDSLELHTDQDSHPDSTFTHRVVWESYLSHHLLLSSL